MTISDSMKSPSNFCKDETVEFEPTSPISKKNN